jgi:hypothetical protein
MRGLFNVKVFGGRDLENAFIRYERGLGRAGYRGVWKATRNTANAIQEKAPSGVTGYLKKSIKAVKITKKEFGIQMAYYGEYVENGTRPRWTTGAKPPPPAGKVRAWAGAHGMTYFTFMQVVSSAGTQEHPFIVPTLAKEYEHIFRVCYDEVGKEFKKKINNRGG